MALNLRHQTPQQFATRFWLQMQANYAAGQAGNEDAKVQFCRGAWKLSGWIAAGDVTSDQARQSYNTVFGTNLNTTQWNNTKVPILTAARDKYQAILDQQAI